MYLDPNGNEYFRYAVCCRFYLITNSDFEKWHQNQVHNFLQRGSLLITMLETKLGGEMAKSMCVESVPREGKQSNLNVHTLLYFPVISKFPLCIKLI